MSLYDRLAAKSSKVVLSDGSIVDDYDANGNKKVALQGSKKQLSVINADYATPVASGGSATITVSPTTGYMARIIAAYIAAVGPATATSGTHSATLFYGSDSVRQLIAQAKSDFGDLISVTANSFVTSTNAKVPATDEVLAQNLTMARFTVASPLKVLYANNTDKTQSGTLRIRLVVEEEAVV